MKWQKIVDVAQTDVYQKKLSEIAEVLLKSSENPDQQGNIALMGGKTGVALFFFYYAKYTNEGKYYDIGMTILDSIFDEINKDFVYHTFAGGLAGIGWTVEHLIQADFIEADSDEILGDLDPYLHKMMIADIQNKNYDFLHGAVGNGIYFLNRLSSLEAKNFLIELIDELDKISVKDEDGSIKWWSILNRDDGTEGFNLSLSHGIASIIAFLGKLYEKGVHKEKVSALLEGAVCYLLKHTLDTSKYLSNFPSWIPKEEQPLSHSRLAWCYGDLGIGIALWQAARSIGDKAWEKKATDTLLHSSNRKDVKESMVIDAGLCHGATGIAHLFNRMYHYTGLEVFKDTALYWFDHTLKMANHEDGFAGFKAWHTEKYGGWVAETGLLEGVSGIGLALISLLSDIEPGWDRSLLMS